MTDLGGQGVAVGAINVRRVGHHDIDLAVQLGQRIGHVGLHHHRAGAGQVASQPAHRGRVHLDGEKPDAGHLVDQRGADRARARAQFHHQGRSGRTRGLDGRTRDQFGLRTRHEDPGPDGQCHVTEPDSPGQMLHRRSRTALGDQLFIAGQR